MGSNGGDLISVIMPCFNGGGFLEESINSVLLQSYKNFELIVVDDGSTDDSKFIINKFSDVRVKYIYQHNSGVCSARNNALSLATGVYVAFLDADDKWHPDFIMKLHAAINGNPKAVLAYCGWQNVGLPGASGEPFIPPDYESDNKLEILLGGCRWPIHAALTRLNIVRSVGGFDFRYSTSEDYFLWLKVSSRGEISHVPEVLAYYIHHQDERATSDRAKIAVNQWLVQKEFSSNDPEVINKFGQRHLRNIVNGELLRRGYECYWDRDFVAARKIFWLLVKARYGSLADWKYYILSFLPQFLHRSLSFLLKHEKKS